MSQSFQEYKSISRKMPESQVFNNSFIKIESNNMTPLNISNSKTMMHQMEEECRNLDDGYSTNNNVDMLREEMMRQLDGPNELGSVPSELDEKNIAHCNKIPSSPNENDLDFLNRNVNHKMQFNVIVNRKGDRVLSVAGFKRDD
jgi:hypothetical protein